MITFDDFKRADFGGVPTFVLPLPNGCCLRVRKHDEDADKGYFYTVAFVTKDGKRVTELGRGYFDGFGCEDRPNDVIHFVRACIARNTAPGGHMSIDMSSAAELYATPFERANRHLLSDLCEAVKVAKDRIKVLMLHEDSPKRMAALLKLLKALDGNSDLQHALEDIEDSI